MQIAALQNNIYWEDKKKNFSHIENLIAKNPPQEDSLIILPEMFATGFSMNVPEIAETEAGESISFLKKLAATYNSTAIGGLVTRGENNKGNNQASVINKKGEEVLRYTKMHPFSYAGENNYFNQGNELKTFQWNKFKAALFICYDLRFPEIFRSAVLKGVNLFIIIANWPEPREQHWMALLKARAIENQAFVIGVNRTGNDPKLSYSGRSRIIDPVGNIIADGEKDETLIQAELNFDDLKKYRETFPFLNDMRRDFNKGFE